jgi:hypothetical protein
MKDQSEGTFSSVIPANQYGVLHAEFRTGIVTDASAGFSVHNDRNLQLTNMAIEC